jgi:hypothetical protein
MLRPMKNKQVVFKWLEKFPSYIPVIYQLKELFILRFTFEELQILPASQAPPHCYLYHCFLDLS